MLTRLFLSTTARNLYKFHKHILVTQRHAALPKYSVAQTKWLHVKVFDKDAGLETKRAANTRPQNDGEPSEIENKSQLYKTRTGKNTDVGKAKTLQKTEIKNEPVKSLDVVKSQSTDISNDPDVFGNTPKESVEEDEDLKGDDDLQDVKQIAFNNLQQDEKFLLEKPINTSNLREDNTSNEENHSQAVKHNTKPNPHNPFRIV